MQFLGALMDGLYSIGNKCFPETPERLFAHQIVDGFIIVSEFGSQSLENPVCIAISLMRHLLISGGVAKATIAEGEFADITGCYPKYIIDDMDLHGRVPLGEGIMTLFTVMGTALIRAVGVKNISPSGSLLLVNKSLRKRLPQDIPFVDIDDNLISIDWIHAKHNKLDNIQQKANLKSTSIYNLEEKLELYMKHNSLKKTWKDNTRKLLSMKTD